MHYGHRSFWGNAAYISPPEAIQHEISDHQDALGAELIEQGSEMGSVDQDEWYGSGRMKKIPCQQRLGHANRIFAEKSLAVRRPPTTL
jgi:hypothetical protein